MAHLPLLATSDLNCREIEYELSIFASADELRLDLHQTANRLNWSATFHARYLEEITQKTGSAKRFDVFIKMLCAALQGRDDGLHLDVLTFADLQLLKNRKAASGHSEALTPSGSLHPANNKRYLILTYASAFDRVHFPLPLSFQGPAGLQKPEQRGIMSRGSADASEFDVGIGDESLEHRFEALTAEKDDLQRAYEWLQRETGREVAKARRQSESLTLQLQEQAEQMSELRSQLATQATQLRQTEKLRTKLRRAEQHAADERSTLQRALEKHKKEIILLNSELSRAKREEERLRRHVRQLEVEHKMLQRRTAASNGSRGSYADNPRRADWARGASKLSGPPRAESADRWERGSGSRGTSASRTGRGPPPHAVSLPASRTGSRTASRTASRPPSVCSSTAASRAHSAERQRVPSSCQPRHSCGSQHSSRASSRVSSAASSRASSIERGRSARSSPSERMRAEFRGATAQRHQPREASRSWGSNAPSLELAAREALRQSALAQRSKAPHARLRQPQPSPRVSTSAEAQHATQHAPGPMLRGGAVLRAQPFTSDSSDVDEEKASMSMPVRRAVPAPAHTKGKLELDSQKENRAQRLQARSSLRNAQAMPARPSVGADADQSAASYDAASDINDIDRRLEALQDFLRAAKAPN